MTANSLNHLNKAVALNANERPEKPQSIAHQSSYLSRESY